MRFYFILLLFSFAGYSVFAQSKGCDPIDDLTTGFEQCPLDNNGIANGCAQGWFPSSGSPTVTNNIGGITPFNGSRMVGLSTSNSFSLCRTEAMFLDVSSLIPGEDYELSVWVHTQNSLSPSSTLQFFIDYTSGVAVSSNPSVFGPCLPNTGTSLFSSTSFSATSWTNITIPFTAEAGKDQIHFHPKPGSVNDVRLLIDDVSVSFCDPCTDIEEISASFRLAAQPITSNLYFITPTLYDTYSNIGGQHTWLVYTSSDPNGPYTFSQQYNGVSFTHNGRPGTYYTVLHKVETECGTACYGWNICQGCGSGFQEEELCDLCGPIDCSFVDEACTFVTPEPYGCWYFSPWGTIIGWSSLPDATYEVQFYPYGDCCDNSQFFWPFTVTANDNRYNPPASVGNCFRYRVRAICDKSVSAWSDFQCVNLNECNFWEYRPGQNND
ncbi:MAG: hypothetical protein AAF544_09650, partial [Bacteroidota bacterium]